MVSRGGEGIGAAGFVGVRGIIVHGRSNRLNSAVSRTAKKKGQAAGGRRQSLPPSSTACYNALQRLMWRFISLLGRPCTNECFSDFLELFGTSDLDLLQQPDVLFFEFFEVLVELVVPRIQNKDLKGEC